jgi:hypothetical protein
MEKGNLLKEILARAGDPNALSSTFKDLAWSLFIEKAYEGHPSLSLVESKDLLQQDILSIDTDGNGRGSYAIPWRTFSSIAEIAVLTENGYIPTQEITAREFANMTANPFFAPCTTATSTASGQELFHFYDGRNLTVLTGLGSTTITVALRTYPDLRDLLSVLGDSDSVPLHNSFIHKLIPLVAKDVKAEIGMLI